VCRPGASSAPRLLVAGLARRGAGSTALGGERAAAMCWPVGLAVGAVRLSTSCGERSVALARDLWP
ncbi:MAG: hypothetical protein Q8K99_10890, partial [Actinomycetota bacterium]|nr:hypothetical protein [Actinomycetota bacterium]